MTAFPHLVSSGTFARLLYNIFQHNSKASLEKKKIILFAPTARKLQQEHIRHMKMVCCSTLLVSSGGFLDIILSRN